MESVDNKDLMIGAFIKRNDPRDAFLSNSSQSLFQLRPNSKIGTSSFRRQAQLKLLRKDIKIFDKHPFF